MTGQDETRERQLLVERISGTVGAIAYSLAAEVGDRWLDDLKQQGHLGALEAARAYRFDSGTSYEGFAWPRITGAMIDFLRRERVKLKPALAAALERAAAAIDVAADHTAQVRDKGEDILEEEADGAAAVVGIGLLCLGAGTSDPETLLLREEQRAQVRRAVALLRERDQTIVTLRYFEQTPFADIAAHFGIHVDSARDRHHKAMRRLGAILRPILLRPLATPIAGVTVNRR